jgi:hypothetical protein
VQRVEDLLEDAQDDTRRALRAALSGLHGDPTQLEQLFKLIERVILEDPKDLSVKKDPPPPTGPLGVKKAPTKVGLGVSLADATLHKRLQRAKVGGDLLTVLDAFIFKLGPLNPMSPEAAANPPIGPGLAIDDDGESAPDIDPEIGYLLAEKCRKKLHTLIARLIKRLEEASESADGASIALARFVAALGLIHYFRANAESFSWRPRSESLVDSGDRLDIFDAGTRLFFGQRPGLAGRALAESKTGELAELSNAKALLCWLGYDLDYDLGVPSKFAEDDEGDPDLIAYDLEIRVSLLHCLSEVVRDVESRRLLGERIKGYDWGQQWLDRHIAIAERLHAAKQAADQKPPRELKTGDLVRQHLLPDSPYTVVVWASSKKAGVVDLGTGEWTKQVLVQYLRRADVAGWKPLK